MRTPRSAPKGKKTVLRTKLRSGETPAESVANMAVAGLEPHGVAIYELARPQLGDTLDLTEIVAALYRETEKTQANDLSGVEARLTAQAATLDALFLRLLTRATGNMGQFLKAGEIYMRLALRAQAQSRATMETLALVKNPPVFARQANIATTQQVTNNTQNVAVVGQSDLAGTRVEAGAPRVRGTLQGRRDKLLDAGRNVKRLDTGAPAQAINSDTAVVPLAPLHRAENGGRKGALLAERVSRCSTSDSTPTRGGTAESARET